jgi:hypothetical protein
LLVPPAPASQCHSGCRLGCDCPGPGVIVHATQAAVILYNGASAVLHPAMGGPCQWAQSRFKKTNTTLAVKFKKTNTVTLATTQYKPEKAVACTTHTEGPPGRSRNLDTCFTGKFKFRRRVRVPAGTYVVLVHWHTHTGRHTAHTQACTGTKQISLKGDAQWHYRDRLNRYTQAQAQAGTHKAKFKLEG